MRLRFDRLQSSGVLRCEIQVGLFSVWTLVIVVSFSDHFWSQNFAILFFFFSFRLLTALTSISHPNVADALSAEGVKILPFHWRLLYYPTIILLGFFPLFLIILWVLRFNWARSVLFTWTVQLSM